MRAIALILLASCSGPNVPAWLRDKGAPRFTYGPEPTENQHRFGSVARDAGAL